jgi:D-alanine--D-alanine ligase
MRVGLAFNLKRRKPERGGHADEEAEYDAPSTVRAIHEAIASWGHEVIDLEADRTFPTAVSAAGVDIVFNVAEGAGGRGREAHVPAVLELLGIPYTGSDPGALVVTLDKALAKAAVREAGVRTPRSIVMTRGDEPWPDGLAFPVIVKPVAEGSSKGVLPASVARTEEEAREIVRPLVARYAQGALVEEFLPGREFTVALLGSPVPTVLAPMEIVFTAGEELPVYSFDHKLEPTDQIRYDIPARVTPELEHELRDLALRSFLTLGCRDVGRVDLRLDREGRPSFIECNPLPGLTPGWSDLCLIAEPAGLDYRSLVGRILGSAIARAGLPATEA